MLATSSRSPAMSLAALEDLTRSTCHWPVAEFERGVFLFCGEAVDPSTSSMMRCYCAQHAALAYRWTPTLSPPQAVTHDRSAVCPAHR